jgi:micrococcal nuclease
VYEYAATITRIYDADSVFVDVDLGWHVWRRDEELRLHGIDAPELKTPEGKAARDWLKQRLPVGGVFTVRTIKDKDDKYGRLLAVITDDPDKPPINQELIDAGLARPYFGTGPKPW